MIGLLQILDILKAIFQFPTVLFQFVQLLRKTPQEKHEEILKKVELEARKFEDTGRPTWG